MKIRTIIGLAATGIIACACQSDSYQIKGYARQLQDGDTITLQLEDSRQILGQTLVAEGKFSFSGTTDTTVFCRAYQNSQPLTAISFFLEPGSITIELHPYPKPSRVSGTVLNNQWQQLNDSVQLLGDQLIRLAERSTTPDAGNRQQLQQRIDSLHRALSGCIINTARRNQDNVLGKYIRQNYKEPEFK